MFSYDIVIRNTDAHPIYKYSTGEQINKPIGDVYIEPHVWIGERVSILKSVTIGACSILAYGTIVTKTAPRFSIAKGVPASYVVDSDVFWSLGSNERLIYRAKYYTDKYKKEDKISKIFKLL